MATTRPYRDAGEDRGVEPDGGATTGPSRWQKVVGILGLVVVLWVGSNLFDAVNRGDDARRGHGPPGQTPPAGVTNRGGQTPPGVEDGHDPSTRRH